MSTRYVVLCLFLSNSCLLGQVSTGSLSGYILDPSDRAVAGAPIALRGVDRGANRSGKTDQTGFYVFDELAPGQYELAVDAQGFAQAHTEAVRVEVDHRARIDIRLVVAGRQDKVTVTGHAPDLNTESAELGSVIDQSRMESLPLNKRDFLQLALLTAGVAPPVQGSELSTRGTFAVHANGGREEANNYLLDGVDNNDSDNGGYVLQPSVDAIQEFKMATNSYSAEYGKASAGQINVITRGGTDQLHGSAYDYLRNRDLDARNFFDGATRPKYIRNQFGTGIGGPIRRDHTFFYGSFEGLRERQGLTQLGSVPTDAVRGGDLSSLGVTVYNPFTGQPFAGNKIPASFISPYAQQILALFPRANLPGAGANYLGNPTATGDLNQASGRIDHRLSASSELSFRYSYGQRNLFEPFSQNQTQLPGFGDNLADRGQNALLHLQQTLGAGSTNSVILGFNRVVRKILVQNSQTNVNAAWGVNYLPTDPRDFGYPGISVTGYSRVGDVAALPIDRADNTYQMVDNLSMIRGAHTLKLGGELRDLQLNGYVEVYSRGQMSFTGALTGSGIGDLLMGLPTFAIQSRYTGPQTLRSKSWSGYFQDDWKAARNLTVNLGVRYEFDTPATDPTNRMATFNFRDGKVEQVGTNGLARSGTQAAPHNFAPRVGFSWSPMERTVVRGGYGLYYDSGMFVVNSSLYYNPPFFTISVYFPSATSLVTLANPFAASNGFVPPAALSIVSPDFVPSYTQHWNLDLQRELAHAGVLSIAYAGAKGTHLPRSLDINQPLTPGAAPVSSRAPFPAYSNILMTESGGNSSYNSLQVTFNRRLSHGLSVLAAYTFSKSIDDTSAFLPTVSDQNFPQNSHNYRLERSLSSYDVPQRFTAALVQQMPGSNRWTRGFELSSIVTAQSGQPFTPMLSSDNSNTGNSGGNFGVDRPNVAGNPALANRSPQEWFNVNAFAIPAPYTWGNAGRNILRGPGLFTVDLALRRTFALGEKVKLLGEVQVFNSLNRANFNLPDAYADQPSTFGKILSAKDPRQIQMALRLQF